MGSTEVAARARNDAFYGINDHNNWRHGASEMAYAIVDALGNDHPLLRNTIVCLATARHH